MENPEEKLAELKKDLERFALMETQAKDALKETKKKIKELTKIIDRLKDFDKGKEVNI